MTKHLRAMTSTILHMELCLVIVLILIFAFASEVDMLACLNPILFHSHQLNKRGGGGEGRRVR